MEVYNFKRKTIFENVEELKALYNTFDIGSVVKTKGYYTANDGGGAEYTIREKTTNDVDNDGSILFVDDNLVAEIIVTNINAKQFGCYGDNIHDDTESLNNYITYCNDNNKTIILPYGNYKITDDLEEIKSGISIVGEFENNGVFGSKSTIYDYRTSANYLIRFKSGNDNDSIFGSYIKNIRFNNVNKSNLYCININKSGYVGHLDNLTIEYYNVALKFNNVNAINTNKCTIYSCGGKVANSTDYAISITGCVDITFNELLIEHTRFMILDSTKNSFGHSHKFINCYFELSTCNLVAGYEVINSQSGNCGGTTFDGCTFVQLSAKEIADKLDITTSATFYFMNIENGIISNCKFLNGMGSGQYSATKGGQARYLSASNSIICNNIFKDVLYLERGMVLVNSNFNNNFVNACLQTEDYSSITNKHIILNDSSNVKNNILDLTIPNETNLSSIPRLFKFYEYYKLQSKTPSVTDKYNIKKLYEYGPGNTINSFVIESDDTIYTPIKLNIKRNGNGELLYSGTLMVDFYGNTITQLNLVKKVFSASNDIIVSKISNNKGVIQIVGTNLNNLNVKIEGLETQKINVYFDKSITAENSNTTKLSLKA